MKKFKQTLCHDDSKKYKKNATLTSFSKKGNRTELDSLIECKSTGKIIPDEQLHKAVIDIIERGYIEHEQRKDEFEEVLYQVSSKCNFKSKEESLREKKLEQLQECINVLNQIMKNSKVKKSEKFDDFYQHAIQYADKCKKISKNKTLDDYDRLVRLLSPRHLDKNKLKQKTKPSKQSSGANLNVKITREEYEIKPELSNKSRQLEKVKSISKERLKSIGSNRSSTEKFKNFLKEGSYKVIKTKVQYDYSAILDASKSNIRPRKTNKTTVPESKKAEMWQTKLNKVKKDEGFIFYRPAQGKNQSVVFGGKGK